MNVTQTGGGDGLGPGDNITGTCFFSGQASLKHLVLAQPHSSISQTLPGLTTLICCEEAFFGELYMLYIH